MDEDKRQDGSDKFEDLLGDLPNDLGGIPEIGEPSIPKDDGILRLGSIPVFDNSDLDDLEPVTQDEFEAMVRLFPREALEEVPIGASNEQLKDLAVTKLYKLSMMVQKQYEMRAYMEDLGGDGDDLVSAMLSVVGEMSRLRTLVFKLDGGELETEPIDE